MQKAPAFPVPGHGRYLAPAALRRRFLRHHHGLHRAAPRRRRAVQHLRPGEDRLHRPHPRRDGRPAARARRSCAFPMRVFWVLLWVYALFDRDPPFTTKQLEGAGDAGRVRGDRLAGHLRRQRDAARGRRSRRPFATRATRRSCWSSDGRVVVIGAGAMGLAAAYHALKRGHPVTVLEAAPEPGGMAAHFDLGGLSIERYYHFVCKADQSTFDADAANSGSATGCAGCRPRWAISSTASCTVGAIRFAAALPASVADREAALRRADVLLHQAQRLAKPGEHLGARTGSRAGAARRSTIGCGRRCSG